MRDVTKKRFGELVKKSVFLTKFAARLCPPIGKPTQLAFEYADEDAEDTGKGL